MSAVHSLAENEEAFSHLHYPRTVIPIVRFGRRECLEVIWTERLLADKELGGSPYRLRAWSPEDDTSFAYAMARNPREDINYSVLIYNPDAYTRSLVDIPAFRIFDLHYPSTIELPAYSDHADVDVDSDSNNSNDDIGNDNDNDNDDDNDDGDDPAPLTVPPPPIYPIEAPNGFSSLEVNPFLTRRAASEEEELSSRLELAERETPVPVRPIIRLPMRRARKIATQTSCAPVRAGRRSGIRQAYSAEPPLAANGDRPKRKRDIELPLCGSSGPCCSSVLAAVLSVIGLRSAYKSRGSSDKENMEKGPSRKRFRHNSF